MSADPVTAGVAAPHRALAAADSAPGDLPLGWAWATLREIASVQLGKMLSPKAYDDDLAQLPYLRNENVRWGVIDFGDVKHMGFKPSELEKYSVRPGDLLVCEGGEPGRCAIYRGGPGAYMYQKALHRVRIHPDAVLPDLIQFCLQHYAYSKTMLPRMSETTIQHLPLEKMLAIRIPLSPLAEQRRIVAAIEQQFTRLDAGVAALRRAQTALKRYRAAVLKAAVEGRLTDDWRRAHPLASLPAQADFAANGPPGAISIAGPLAGRIAGADPVAAEPNLATEPATALLARILAERRARWEADLHARGKDPTRTRYPEPAAPDTANLPTLPEGWCWATFEQISDRVTVGHVGPMKDEYIEDGVPFLRSQNVRPNRFDPDGLKFVSREFHRQLAKSALEPGDLLVVRSGSVGVACVMPDTYPEANCSDLVIVKRPILVSPEYAAYYMNSAAQSRVKLQQVGIALTHFNTHSMASLPVPLPPLAEQQAIVAEVERRLSVVVELEAAVTANLARAERLRQAILREAFAGRLVPQDPDDEPASALLERIRREWVEVSIPSGRRSARASNQGLRPPTLTERPAGDKTSMAGTARPVQQEVPWKE